MRLLGYYTIPKGTTSNALTSQATPLSSYTPGIEMPGTIDHQNAS